MYNYNKFFEHDFFVGYVSDSTDKLVQFKLNSRLITALELNNLDGSISYYEIYDIPEGAYILAVRNFINVYDYTDSVLFFRTLLDLYKVVPDSIKNHIRDLLN